MSQSYEEYLKACSVICTESRKLEASTQWREVNLLESHGTSWMRIVRSLPGLRTKTTGSHGSTVTVDNEENEADPEALDKCVAAPAASVIYDIIHSPSYRVPVLYMSIQGGPSPSLDEVYNVLVPDIHRSPIMTVGVMGALTMTEHPLTGMPVFFIHPCRTAEAMQSVVGHEQPSPEQYLMLWLGLTGVGVGLSLPVELATSILEPPKVDVQS